MAKLLYQGHGSYRITSADGAVAYIDPFAGEGYDIPADIILVTHQHADHNKTELPPKNPSCEIITNTEALAGDRHNSFSVCGFDIEAVEASNFTHNPKKCVGYIIAVDGITIYAAGDTSKTKQMETFAERKLDYALLPCDGIFNMNVKEASECAEIINAKHSIPIHMKPGGLFSRKTAEKFQGPGKTILEPGQELEL